MFTSSAPEIFVVGIVAAVLIAIGRRYRRKVPEQNLPPCVFQFPVIGAIPFIKPGALHETFSDWATKFGRVFSCRLGPQMHIVLNDYRVIKQVCGSVLEAFSGRPRFFLLDMAKKPEEPSSVGIILNEGEAWKIHRRFTSKVFRSFGVGTSVFEDVIMEEAAQLVTDFETQSNRPFDSTWYIKKAVGNVIAYILFGKRFTHTDENFVQTVKFIDQTIEENMGGAALMNFYPWMRHLPPFRKIYTFLKEELHKHWNRVEVLIKSRGELPVHDANVQNYVDSYLSHMEATKDPYFTAFQLNLMVGDIFTAGFATTAATLRWALLYLADNVTVQTKVQKELDSMIGKERPLRWSDKSMTPYLEAVIMETQRTATVVPFAVPRRATEDTKIDGYDVPAESLIMPNLWFVHHDPKNFADPNKFIPERFLSTDGKTLAPEAFMPFGTGIRSCPGELLARMELYIVLGTLLQNFALSLPPGAAPNYQPKQGSTYEAQYYRMVATKR